MKNLYLKRVVVTGMGAITPLGNTVAEYWQGLLQGRSGIGPITLFDASKHDCRIAAQVKGFDPCDYLERKEAKRMDRFAQFAVCASRQALADARFTISDLNADLVGVIIGSGFGGIKVLEEQQEVYLTRGPDRCSPFMVPMMIINMAAGLTAIHTGAKGPNSCTVTACAAGSNAVGEAFRIIQRGYAQAMICGGTEAPITSLSVAGFAAAKALSTRNCDPTRASRPL
jgi:3-oxoacyl-[acyl-carrier-protein] synthase II